MKIKNLKWKNYALAFGAPLAIIPTVFAAVACGETSTANVATTTKTPDQKDLTIKATDLSDFAAWLKTNAATYPALTTANLETITGNDMQVYIARKANSLPQEKQEILSQVQNAMIAYAFENNQNNTDKLKDMVDFVNNSALGSYFNLRGNPDGPWRSSTDTGRAVYERNDLVTFRRNINDVLSLTDSEFTEAGKNLGGEYVGYNLVSGPDMGTKVYDDTFAVPGGLASTMSYATTYSLFRTRVNGIYKSSVNDQGQRIYSSTQTKSTVLSEGLNIAVTDGKATPNFITPDMDGQYVTNNNKDLVAALNDPKNNTIVIRPNAETYATVDSSGKVVASNQKLTGKDFFYGLVRTLYVSKTQMKSGLINGKETGLPKLSDAEIKRVSDTFAADNWDSFDNSNAYLYDLYNLDIKATVEANLALTNDQDFLLVFGNKGSGITTTALNLILNTSGYAPVPYKVIDAEANGQSSPVDKYGLISYGQETISNNKVTTKEYYSISPYLFTNYDTTTTNGTGYIQLKRNPFYNGSKPVVAGAPIDTYTIKMTNSSVSSDAFVLARKDAFLKNAEKLHEYTAYGDVTKISDYVAEIRAAGYENFLKSDNSGYIGTHLNWNPYASNDPAWNDLGRAMLWGKARSAADTNADPSSLDYFYSKDGGAEIRAAINASTNWYTLSQLYFPGQSIEFYSGILGEDGGAISGLTPSDLLPSFMDSTDDLRKIYQENQGSAKLALWTSKTKAAGELLQNAAKKLGATPQNPARIPMFRYSFSDSPDTNIINDANEQILTHLNSLTDGTVRFEWVPYIKWTDMYTLAAKLRTSTYIFTYFGPDYPGAGTVYSQYIQDYGNGSIVALIKQALKI